MTAMIAKLTATQGSVAFNLALSLIFGLSAVSAYGVLYSLLEKLRAKQDLSSQSENSHNLSLSLLGPVFILIVSNLEGFLEVLHARGLFWKLDETGFHPAISGGGELPGWFKIMIWRKLGEK
jgi:uncharacterized membrane protein